MESHTFEDEDPPPFWNELNLQDSTLHNSTDEDSNPPIGGDSTPDRQQRLACQQLQITRFHQNIDDHQVSSVHELLHLAPISNTKDTHTDNANLMISTISTPFIFTDSLSSAPPTTRDHPTAYPSYPVSTLSDNGPGLQNSTYTHVTPSSCFVQCLFLFQSSHYLYELGTFPISYCAYLTPFLLHFIYLYINIPLHSAMITM